MKFVAISKATQHLQGWYVGFIGDRTTTKKPNTGCPATAEDVEVGNKNCVLGCKCLRGIFYSGPNQEGEAVNTRPGRHP